MAKTIEGAQWRNATPSGTANWVYLPAGATATVVGEYGDMTSTDATTIQVSGVANVTGDDSNATATLASGCAISDVTVTGSAAGGLIVTVGSTAYSVNSSGKLSELPLLTKAEASETYLGKSDTAARATTADTLTTRRVLTISDNSVTNKGPGVYFSGGANINIKLPAYAIFTQLTAANLVLGTAPSTVEGAMWIEWS